jgi:hypothetical protein
METMKAVVFKEYLEMPGLALTKPQAQRLWDLDGKTCEVLLEEMVSAKFLRKTPDEMYVRADLER